jgi:hypothetical protein
MGMWVERPRIFNLDARLSGAVSFTPCPLHHRTGESHSYPTNKRLWTLQPFRTLRTAENLLLLSQFEHRFLDRQVNRSNLLSRSVVMQMDFKGTDIWKEKGLLQRSVAGGYQRSQKLVPPSSRSRSSTLHTTAETSSEILTTYIYQTTRRHNPGAP